MTTAITAPTMQASLRWGGGLAFEAAGMGGATLRIDQSPDKGGSGVGFKPMALLLHALGSCMGMTVASILAKQRISPREYRIELTGERQAEWPQAFTHIVADHVFRGDDLNRTNLERLVALAEEKYCSVSATLPRGLVEHRVTLLGETDG